MKRVLKIVGIMLLAAIIYAGVTGGSHELANTEMQKVENQVAEDAVKQYEIAKRQGDKMQTYVSAGVVSAAYLQAKDEANYNKWKAIEKEAGRDAGVPSME